MIMTIITSKIMIMIIIYIIIRDYDSHEQHYNDIDSDINNDY